MEAHAELECLLAEQFDGPPDATRNQRLDDLLRAHPELQEDYLDYLQLHALLQWRAGKALPQTTPAPTSTPEAPLPVPVSASAPRWRTARGLAAALLVLAASLAAFFLFHIPEAQATPDLVERLIDWNLDLTQAQTPEERTRIYESQAAELKAKLADAELPPEDRVLAESLVENSVLLVKKIDFDAEYERFTDIADKLVVRMDSATTAHDEKTLLQLAAAFERVNEVGVKENLARARTLVVQDAERKQKWERARMRHANMTTQVADIIERNPEPSRKAIRKAMKGHGHKKNR